MLVLQGMLFALVNKVVSKLNQPQSYKKSIRRASRRNHVYLKHTGERKYACSYCSETFYQRGKYNVHLRRHTGSLPFSCDVCQKRFITNVALKGHMICRRFI